MENQRFGENLGGARGANFEAVQGVGQTRDGLGSAELNGVGVVRDEMAAKRSEVGVVRSEVGVAERNELKSPELNSGQAAEMGRSEQGALGRATLKMPEPGAMPPGMELGVIVNENDREREELTGERPIGTDRPKVQDREGLSPERLSYIERGIAQRMRDLHELKKFATVEMEAELKGRYGRIFGGEN